MDTGDIRGQLKLARGGTPGTDGPGVGENGDGERAAAGLPATAGAAAAARPPDHRLADALAGLTALGVDVDIRNEPDGRVAVVMPGAWASLYLATIRAQAETMQERLHKADREARGRAAEEYVRSGEPARAWEAEQAAIFAEYRRLVARGVAHRAALHRLKAQSGGRLTVTDLEEVVRAGRAKQRRAERAARAEGIRRLHADGMTPEQIGEREGLTVDQVRACLRRGRLPLASFGSRVAQRERRDRILALHRQGMMPREIVARTGLAWTQVMHAIKGVPRRTARPRASADG